MTDDIRLDTTDPATSPDQEVENILKEFQLSAPDEEFPLPEPLPPEEKKGVSALKIVLIVCAILVVLALAAVGLVYYQWNQRFDAAQPEQKSVEVFSLLFKDPDWNLLYTMAGMEDTEFEGPQDFVAYMESLVKGEPLYYMEVSSPDIDLRRYLVVCQDTVLGEFTMVNSGGAIPNWQLDEVTLQRVGSKLYHILKNPEHTVYINGVPLDDSYIIRSTTTLAEAFLPEGLHGKRVQELLITGLMLEPAITVLDAEGNPVAMELNEQTGVFAPAQQPDAEIADQHRQFALDAAKASAAFAVRGSSFTALRQYFDPNSNAYQMMQSSPALLEGCATYTFDPTATQVTNYRSYGADAFSVTVSLKLDATQENGDAQSFDFTWHYLLSKNYSGNFMITEVSEESFHMEREQIRITTVYDGDVLSSELVDSDAATLQLPQIPAPEGKTFAGWAREITDANGKVTMGILFTPDETGLVTLPEETELEPMTLYAIFE